MLDTYNNQEGEVRGMRWAGKRYKICSCGQMISCRSRNTIKQHRDMGHKIPMKHYSKADALKLNGELSKKEAKDE